MDVQLTPVNDLAIIEKKRSSWGAMGIKIHQQELELQVRAQDALKKAGSIALQLLMMCPQQKQH
jgi:hypothetical protein